MPNLERFIEDMQGKLQNLDFESKRLALDMLSIKVYFNNDRDIEITGIVEQESRSDCVIIIPKIGTQYLLTF